MTAAARAAIVAGATVMAAAISWPMPAEARFRPRQCRGCLFPPLVPILPPDGPPIDPPARLLPNPYVPEPGVPLRDAPGRSDIRGGSQRFGNPYSQGFALTYTVTHDDAARVKGPLNRYADVGKALVGCWDASDITGMDWREVTVRVSFKRDGSINGVPRIQHLDAPGGEQALSDLRTGFLSTLGRCAPLPVSPSLGAAIAGQIFAIRFIQAKDT